MCFLDFQVVGFDGSTTIEEFEATLTDLIGCRPVNHSGFSIFSDDPLDPSLHHSLAKQEKVKCVPQYFTPGTDLFK